MTAGTGGVANSMSIVEVVSDEPPAKKNVNGKKKDSKVLTSFNDNNYVSSEEEDDTRQGGQKTFHLLPKVAVPCRKKSNLNKKIARCIGSAGCRKEYRWPRDKT